MTRKLCANISNVILVLILTAIPLLPLITGIFASAAPEGVSITFNDTYVPTPQGGTPITTVGGSFTTLALNLTQQTPRWKAYVGNLTGRFVLQDANNYSIYDWNTASVSGEVYATRNNSIQWSAIRCANATEIAAEEAFHNMTSTQPDTINKTFNNTVHRGFFVGSTYIANSTCSAIATYVNGTAQAPSENADFQEVLLSDTNYLVWATLLEQDAQGYNNQPFDFQMIVPESEVKSSPTTYYFYAELS
ncbi:hypothetical protein D6783_06095 [Candidatus Woesearchaeota archaeon]|nr:MAG: hypothetical protein D6783_06095 [Candidatus Woesearchaeota archaeon]